MNIPSELARLLHEVPALSRAYLVGGCVATRSWASLTRIWTSKSTGWSYEQLEQALSRPRPGGLGWKIVWRNQILPQSGAQVGLQPAAPGH